MQDDVAQLRAEYGRAPLRATDAGSDPLALFARWFADARGEEGVPEPNAMALATVAADGVPSNRMVLLKGVDPGRSAFTWFTNLDSRKAREALGAGCAALCWWWPGEPGRQVRAVGRVEEVSRSDAAAYFATRPAAARVAAATSHQSRPIATRAELEGAARVDGMPPELPKHWGGLCLVADELEFWQGRAGRLHDRIVFLRVDGAGVPVSLAACVAAACDADPQDAVSEGARSLHAAGTVVTDGHGARWLRVRLQP